RKMEIPSGRDRPSCKTAPTTKPQTGQAKVAPRGPEVFLHLVPCDASATVAYASRVYSVFHVNVCVQRKEYTRDAYATTDSIRVPRVSFSTSILTCKEGEYTRAAYATVKKHARRVCHRRILQAFLGQRAVYQPPYFALVNVLQFRWQQFLGESLITNRPRKSLNCRSANRSESAVGGCGIRSSMVHGRSHLDTSRKSIPDDAPGLFLQFAQEASAQGTLSRLGVNCRSQLPIQLARQEDKFFRAVAPDQQTRRSKYFFM